MIINILGQILIILVGLLQHIRNNLVSKYLLQGMKDKIKTFNENVNPNRETA